MARPRNAVLVIFFVAGLALFAAACGDDDNKPGIVATVSSGAAAIGGTATGAATSISGAGTSVSGTVTSGATSVSGTVTAAVTPLSGTVTSGATSVSGTVTSKATSVSGTVTAGATAAGGAQGGADNQVCVAATSLKTALQSMAALNSSSTVAQAQQARDSVQTAVNALRTAGQQAYAAAVSDVQTAYNNLNAIVNSLPPNQTLGQTAAQLQGYVNTTQLADYDLAKPANCPGF